MWTDVFGTLVWIAGFLIQVVADQQLKYHLANPTPGEGKVLKKGLWRYSRHPNYFGEAVMWWGLYFIACGQCRGYVTIFSPILITVCLRFVTGVPFPEKKHKDDPEWQ